MAAVTDLSCQRLTQDGAFFLAPLIFWVAGSGPVRWLHGWGTRAHSAVSPCHPYRAASPPGPEKTPPKPQVGRERGMECGPHPFHSNPPGREYGCISRKEMSIKYILTSFSVFSAKNRRLCNYRERETRSRGAQASRRNSPGARLSQGPCWNQKAVRRNRSSSAVTGQVISC